MDNVSIKVLEDARDVRSLNIKEAGEKAAAIMAEAAGKVKQKKAEARTGADDHYKKTLEMEMFKARSELEQKVLQAKLELVDAIIEELRTRLGMLDRKGWEKFLKKAAARLDIESGTYTIGKKEKILDDSLASIIKGIKPGSEEADFDRGLKITGGRAEILLSPESYLDMDIEDLKMEIAKYLFSGEK
jgi:vacuolar-type H+-ATPase subunit E/Vma4